VDGDIWSENANMALPTPPKGHVRCSPSDTGVRVAEPRDIASIDRVLELTLDRASWIARTPSNVRRGARLPEVIDLVMDRKPPRIGVDISRLEATDGGEGRGGVQIAPLA
jgi:hypothetical protein